MKALLKRTCSFLSGEDDLRAAVDDGVVSDMRDSTRKGFSDYSMHVIMFFAEGCSENICSE